MRKITVEKIYSVHSDTERGMRGIDRNVYEGVMVTGPTPGLSFRFIYASKDDGQWDTDFYTSTVKSVEYDTADTLKVKTINSTYKIVLGTAFNEY